MSKIDLSSRTIIPTTLSWKKVMLNSWKVQESFSATHYKTHLNDFDYLGNINIAADDFLSLPRQSTYFRSLNREKNYLSSCVFEIDDPALYHVKQAVGLRHCAGAAQTLASGKVVFPHYDAASLNPDPEKVGLLTRYYRKLEELYSDDLENHSIDRVFNVFILFLEEWQHGQAFMIGRQAYTCWKPGDLITFPWYMIHSTVNASMSDDRLLLYLAGFIE